MSNNNKTPAIRFKGFTDTWEQREFGDLCKIVTKQTGFDYTATIKESLLTSPSEDTLPYLQTKNFTGISIDYNTDYFIPKSVAKEFPKINLDEKCLLFSIVGASVGNIGLFPGEKHCFLSGAICVSKLINQNDADYLYHFMCSDNGQIQIHNCTKGGAQATVTIEDIRSFAVLLPTESERSKIGTLLTNIDFLITLHQRKLEKLKNVKKSMLKKMFTQNGESVPEIRFAGFTDEWEQRKLGELADIVGGGTPSTSNFEYWDGDIDWYTPVEIADQIFVSSSERKITQQGYNNSSAKILPVGTVLFTSRAGIGKTAILRKEGCTNQGFQSIVPHKNELDSYFIFSRSEEMKRYGETVGAGSTFVEVSGKQMANMELMMPTTMEEQVTIGSFFRSLDTLITLHQRKCDKYKSIKAGLIRKLFP